MSLWIKNAKIATMNDQMPEASSAVVIGDFFAYVGDEQGAEAFLREHPQQNLQMLDCKGQFVMPGINDSHMHYMHYCKAKMGADLSGCGSLAEVIDRMKDFFDNRYDKTSGLWVTGEGWNQDHFADENRFPTCADLDKVTTEYPILVMRTCFHVGALNSKAMELLGINADTVGKYGEYAERWPDGTPNGVVKEIVLDDIKCNLPAPSLEQLLDKLIELAAQELGKPAEAIRETITYVKDRPGHDRRYAIDCTKLKEELGWQRKMTFEEGLVATVKWNLSHQDWIARIRSGEYRSWVEANYGDR